MKKTLDDRNTELFNMENKFEQSQRHVQLLETEKTNLSLEVIKLNNVIKEKGEEIRKLGEQSSDLIQSNQSRLEQINELNKVNLEKEQQHKKDISAGISKDSYTFNLQAKISTLENQLKLANEQIHFLNIDLKQKNK
jgi:flagellar biosynthesis chaperone FliJ